MILIVIGVIIFVFAALLIKFYLSGIFNGIAYDKGYEDGKFFWLCFWFGIIGYIAVAALPDRKNFVDNAAKPQQEEVNFSQQKKDDGEPVKRFRISEGKKEFIKTIIIAVAVVTAFVVFLYILATSPTPKKKCSYVYCDEVATEQYDGDYYCDYHYYNAVNWSK